MRLRHLSLASIVACVIGLIALTVVAFYMMTDIRHQQAQIRNLLSLEHRVSNLSVASNSLLLHYPEAELRQAFIQEAQQIKQAINDLELNHPGTGEVTRYIDQMLGMLDVEHSRRPADVTDQDSRGPLGLPERSRVVLGQMVGHGIALEDAVSEMLMERERAITRQTNLTVASFALVAIFLGGLCVIAFILIHRQLAGPVDALTGVVDRLKAGDTEARASVTGHNELGELGASFNRLLDQQHRTEADLRQYEQELEERARVLAESQRIAHVGNLRLHIPSGARYWSEETCRIFGVPTDYLNGHIQDFLARIHPEDREAFVAKRERALRGDGTMEADYRIVRPDGTQRVVFQRSELERDEDGNPEYLVGTVQDITEQREASSRLYQQQRLLDAAGRVAHLGGWSVDVGTGLVDWSDVVCDIFEVPRGTRFTVDEAIAFHAPEYRNKIRNAYNRCAEHGEPFDVELEIITAHNHRRWVRSTGEAVHDERGELLRVQGAFQDITTHKQSEAQLERLSRQLRLTLDNIGEAFFTLDRDWRFTYANAEAIRLLEKNESELIGHNLWEQFPDLWEGAIGQAYSRAITTGDAVKVEEFHYPPLGGWFDIRAYPTETGLAVIFSDVTQRHEMVQQLRDQEAELRHSHDQLARLAFEDPLTKVLSRTGFTRELGARMETATPHSQGMVVMLDLINLRHVNDAHGFSVGDRLLQQIGERLQERAGAGGLVGRAGGDEFMIFLPSQEGEDTESRRLNLESAFEAPFTVGDFPIEIVARFGYTEFRSLEHPVEQLLREAELALFQGAGHQDTHHWCCYTPALDQETRERVKLTRELKTALETNQLELHFQPKVDMRTGQVVAAEALLRWHHPERGMVSPGVFIPIAEQSQLIGPIGDWVIEAACQKLNEWQSAGLNLVRIAVNVSLSQFSLGHFTHSVQQTLRRNNVAPQALSLEITESVFESEEESLSQHLNDLHEAGIRLSLDDFGTGYSSLLYLQKYPFDEIKIDRGFVSRMLNDHYSHEIVRTVIGVADMINAEVVAEGVETPEERDALLAMECYVAQGFYYSKPLPASEFRALLEKRIPLPLPVPA